MESCFVELEGGGEEETYNVHFVVGTELVTGNFGCVETLAGLDDAISGSEARKKDESIYLLLIQPFALRLGTFTFFLCKGQ